MDTNPQQWVDEQLRLLNISIFNHSTMDWGGGEEGREAAAAP